MTRIGLLFLLAAALPAASDLRTGFELHGLTYAGPGEWLQPAEPIWVYEYSLVRLRYRAMGLTPTDAAVLTLRPGSVGPVTPGATNRENPFAMGRPVVAITAKDLVADGREHTFETDLRPKILTAQMDQLQWTLPAGAHLTIDELEFRSPAEVMNCVGGPPLPEGVSRLPASAPLSCDGSPATSLRGRESIRIDAAGRRGRALYLSMTAHIAGLSDFAPTRPVDAWRVKESSETANMIVRVRYASGEDEQYPLLVSERRHTLLNRKPALYAVALDGDKPVESVELADRGPHLQLVLHAAGISNAPPPTPVSEELPTAKPPDNKPSGEADLEDSKWYRIATAPGKPAPGEAVRAELKVSRTANGRAASLAVTNTGSEPIEFTLIFPALRVRPAADPDDVYYLFPRQGAVISRAERAWQATYTANFPLQFLDVFAPAANRGAALIVRDTSAQLKVFRMEKTGSAVDLETEYPVRLKPGETFHAPEASVIFHGGDWREGFRAYRQWAASWYKPAGPRPVWLRDAWWCRRDYPVGGSGRLFDTQANRYTYDELIRDGRAFGGIDFIDISGWALSETAGRVGDYPIELGGPEDLRRNVEAGMKSGVPTGLYFEGYLIDRNSNIGKRSGDRWQLIGRDGKGAWWRGGSPELFVCPSVKDWQEYLAARAAAVARETGAQGVYIDEHGFGTRYCYSTAHGHPPGVGMIPYEIEMAKAVRRSLDAAGMARTMIYLEETPVDAAAPYYDAAFCYSIPNSNAQVSPAKLNLWRFVFPDVRLWDMLTIGVQPRPLSMEDFRLSLWHGNGAWLKGRSETWYGEDVLAFLRKARSLLRKHSAAFNGEADPMVASPHPAVLINRFRGGGQTVYTLFNSSYRTVRFAFEGRPVTLAPRDVAVLAGLYF